MFSSMLEIDGRHGEGGGQILRTSIALSALTHTPCMITHIRANRSTPGLRAQHLTGLKTAAQMCDAKTRGLKMGSETVEFSPGDIRGGRYSIEIGTAGSITLLLQTLIPICLHAPTPVELFITGGTDVKWSPTSAYFQKVLCSHLERMGASVQVTVEKYGFYPRGGGQIKTIISPWNHKKRINLTERGAILGIEVDSIASSTLRNPRVAERQASAFQEEFSSYPINSWIQYGETLNPGSSFSAVARCEHSVLGADSLGERGKPAEAVAEEAAITLQKDLESGYALDSHMADQIVPYLAQAGGRVTVAEITGHTTTNVWVCNQFCETRVEVDGHILQIV